jgi:hypothetical protein
MRRFLLLAWIALVWVLCATSWAWAQVHGVAVQVSQGQAIPTTAQIRQLTNPGDFVRDLAPWARTDPNCDLTTGGVITIPSEMQTLYNRVAQTGRKNFVTLGFNNVACGQVSNFGWLDFPNTPQLRAEFAAYAVQLVQSVPNLGGISIWNELNGSFNGGYTGAGSIPRKLAAYCQLVNTVITEVRKVDPNVPIAIGASVGWNIQGWFTNMFKRYGCMGQNDPTIWLDVHPYISGVYSPSTNTGWTKWPQHIAYIRSHGINNQLVATEWGGPAAVKWMQQVPGGNYPLEFQNRILAPDPSWVGAMWFEALYDTANPKLGLLDSNGDPTKVGQDYIGVFVP